MHASASLLLNIPTYCIQIAIDRQQNMKKKKKKKEKKEKERERCK